MSYYRVLFRTTEGKPAALYLVLLPATVLSDDAKTTEGVLMGRRIKVNEANKGEALRFVASDVCFTAFSSGFRQESLDKVDVEELQEQTSTAGEQVHHDPRSGIRVWLLEKWVEPRPSFDHRFDEIVLCPIYLGKNKPSSS